MIETNRASKADESEFVPPRYLERWENEGGTYFQEHSTQFIMNEIKRHPLPIHITPHHLRLSPALSAFARDKFTKIPRFANDVLAAEIMLRRHRGTSDGARFSASGRLALAGNDIHATATHADLYTAIVKLVARLARRSRKRKTRLQKTRATRPPAPCNPQPASSRFD